jgi:hypothetical protein
MLRRARALAAIVVTLVVLVLASCGGDGDNGGTSSAVTDREQPQFTAVPKSGACITVTNPGMLDAINVAEAAAVQIDGESWFVSSADGATWYSRVDPATHNSGFIAPMNDRAREHSDQGADVPADALILRGHTDRDLEAARSRACAAAG